jgi:biotin synthase
MMVGDFLTTPNRSVEDDLKMLDDLGLVPMACGTKDRPELRARVPKRLPVVA